jgi:hypothetical protein
VGEMMAKKKENKDDTGLTGEDFEKPNHGEISEEEYAKFLTFYCRITEDGKEIGNQEIQFTNYNEKDTEAPDELAIHIIEKEGEKEIDHLFTMLPKWEKERLKEFLS